MVKIAAKHEWIEGDKPVGRNTLIFHPLFTRFRELSGKMDFYQLEKEYKYSKKKNNGSNEGKWKLWYRRTKIKHTKMSWKKISESFYKP